jgi:hypothetical protein
MSYLFFVDESGHDLTESPYSVLAAIAVQDSRAWNLISAIQGSEEAFFGERIRRDGLELKAKKMLKSKAFRHAGQLPPLPPQERARLAHECLEEGRAAIREARRSRHTKVQLTALAQAKIAFVGRVLELCAQHQVKAFASIVDRDAPKPVGSFLRKDYSYLFERFFHFLEERPEHHQGLVVFDELERSQSHLLIEQMASYFKQTATGRLRASRIVPEPFFVHSDLTSLIQVADLLAYIVAWGVRFGSMKRPARAELSDLAEAATALRYFRAADEVHAYPIWGFSIIDDLRPRDERLPK